MNPVGKIQEAALGHAGQLAKSVRFVAILGLSIGGAAGCPQDASEEDQSDNWYDYERGSDHD
jgi:hypothetical protein